MIARALQIFSILLVPAFAANPAGAALPPGNVYPLVFRDVDGRDLSTTTGQVLIITVITRESEAKARMVADLLPDRCLGNPKFRYVTLVNFQGKLAGLFHGLTRSIVRNRLDTEARKLRPKYAAKQLKQDPRRDIHVIADFDGAAVSRLGLSPQSSQLAVFVFNGQGKLVARWNDVPRGDSLAKAIAAAE